MFNDISFNIFNKSNITKKSKLFRCDDSDKLSRYAEENKNENFKFSIIVSIYNNGEYLKNVCFNSIKKSSLFNDIEIILVDDGSTDESTLQIINELEKNYTNVKTYFFNDGGSGSPSRPRNMGVTLSTTKYITYLDPDNEAYGDGYAKLYNEISSNDYDLVIGEIIFKSSRINRPNSYCKSFISNNNGESVLYNSGKDMLLKTNFGAQSIQACLIKKDLLINNDLKMVFGGAGEDTLFFYELLLNSQKTKIVEDVIHIYHMSREDSITNDINREFFKKNLGVELEKRNFLEKNGLLSAYMERKYDFHFKHFIFLKLNNVINNDEKEYCFNYIDSIYKIFYDVWKVRDPALKKYFESRNIYRDKPFNETLVVYLYDDGLQDTLNKLSKKNQLDNVEIILMDYNLKIPENISLASSFEATHKNVKLYYQNPKENISKSEIQKRSLYMITTDKISHVLQHNL